MTRVETSDRVIAQVRVTDNSGSDYILPYPCEAQEGGMGQCCLRQAIGRACDLLEALCRDFSEE